MIPRASLRHPLHRAEVLLCVHPDCHLLFLAQQAPFLGNLHVLIVFEVVVDAGVHGLEIVLPGAELGHPCSEGFEILLAGLRPQVGAVPMSCLVLRCTRRLG